MTANDNDPIAAKMAALRKIASGAVMQARALLGSMTDAEIRVLAAMAEWDVQKVGRGLCELDFIDGVLDIERRHRIDLNGGVESE